MKLNANDSKIVALLKRKLSIRYLKLKGSRSPDINVLVKREIEELEQQIKRIVAAESNRESNP